MDVISSLIVYLGLTSIGYLALYFLFKSIYYWINDDQDNGNFASKYIKYSMILYTLIAVLIVIWVIIVDPQN